MDVTHPAPGALRSLYLSSFRVSDYCFAQVTKVLFQSGSSAPHVATGVEFAKADGSGARMKAFARKEVILAAGAIQVRSRLPSNLLAYDPSVTAVIQALMANEHVYRHLRYCNCPVSATLLCSGRSVFLRSST